MKEHGYGKYSWAVLTSALLVALSMNLTLFSPGPVLNSIRQELHTSFAEIGLIFTVPAIILSLLTVIGGVLADSVGVRKVAGTGAVLLGLGGLLRATAQDFFSFLLFTTLFAVGLGLALPNLPKAISGWFPESAVGSASGIYVLGFPLGASLASGATPYLAEATRGWQGAFVGWGLITLIFAAVWWIVVREPRRSSSGASRSFRLPKSVLHNFSLWIVAACLFLNTTIFSIEVAWFPTVLAERGASAQEAGVMVSLFALGNMAAAFAVPILSDRIGLRRPFLWAFAGVSAIVVVSLIVTPPAAAWVILPILGFAAAGPFAMGFLLPADFVEYSYLGSASGIVLSVGWLGIGSGSWLAGFLRDLSGSFFTTLVALIICSLVIVALAFILPETGRRGRARKLLEAVGS
ncbi:MAG: MFS transporter [Thaumarchaeota archaeon]|nr:MFS transporter [Nitrososphaerota archaeon]